MSDYLGNLAARSLGPAQAVRPRLASRFEPVPSAPSPFQAETERAALLETAVEETAAAPTRTSRLAETPRRRTAPPEPVEEEPSAPPRRRRARRDPVVEEIEPVPERRRPEPVSTVIAPAPVAMVPLQKPVADRGVPPSEASPPGPLSTRVERGNLGRAAVAQPVLPRPQEAFAVSPRQAPSASSPLSTPVERGPGGEASRANRPGDRELPESKPASTILQPKVTVIEREPFSVHREAPAPTIQVTIGRIEVRATPAAKAPVRERPSAPSALSLEEYLRQRSKGGRG
jgi:hypothetical protein